MFAFGLHIHLDSLKGSSFPDRYYIFDKVSMWFLQYPLYIIVNKQGNKVHFELPKGFIFINLHWILPVL